MASPPEMRVENSPAIRLTRTALPSELATFWTWASLAPVTDESTERTTWSLAGSAAQEMPEIFSVRRWSRWRCRVCRRCVKRNGHGTGRADGLGAARW